MRTWTVVSLFPYITAEGYCCKDGGFVVQLYRMSARGGAGVVGVRLHENSGSAGEPDESQCPTAQENTTGFFEFLLILNNYACVGRLWKA